MHYITTTGSSSVIRQCHGQRYYLYTLLPRWQRAHFCRIGSFISDSISNNDGDLWLKWAQLKIWSRPNKNVQTLTCRCSLFVDDPVSNNWCDRVHEEKVGPILSSSDAWQRTWWRPCLVFLGLFTRRFLLRHLILIELHCLHTTSVPTIQYWGNTNKHKHQPPTTNIIAMSTYWLSPRLLSAELIKMLWE